MKKWKLSEILHKVWQGLHHFDIKPAEPKRVRTINMFENYAERYEEHMTVTLSYTAHQQLVNYCKQNILRKELDSLLDLGCGTGLLGVEFAKHYTTHKLVGVDLATNMLEASKAKGVYHELHHTELCKYLYDNDQSFDVIASTDVMIYFGNLEPILQHAYTRLKPGGYFFFTVEKKAGSGFYLQKNGRFKHSLKYLTSLYNKCQYSRINTQTIDLRTEYGNMVSGYLVSLQK